jgi:hypothetical protein
VGVGLYLWLGRSAAGRRAWPGVALYYVVLAFNLVMTMLIGEWVLAGVGASIHAAVALLVVSMHRSPGAAALGPEPREIQRA